MLLEKQVKDLLNQGIEMGHRTLDRHLRLAVTGLSRAGKTAFITSLVNQLLHSATHDNLPLFKAAQERALLGAKRVRQNDETVPSFEYDLAIEQLSSQPPAWPMPTRDVSEIRLALRFKPRSGALKYFSKTATLYLDIVDYPGEWLLDLPMLNLSFEQWSAQQYKAIVEGRKEYAEPWLDLVNGFDPYAQEDEKEIKHIATAFRDYLHLCKKQGLHWIQPGRFVLPGEYEGAPVLDFFPYILKQDDSKKMAKDSSYALLVSRYKNYQQKIVKAFYKEHFATFDRQIILVDCLQPLNTGFHAFQDMSYALDELMESFKYGRNSFLSRIFSPSIDKVLFAATKSDHITPDQHANQVALLQQLVEKAWQHIAFEGIEMECQSLASIQATEVGYVGKGDGQIQALKGTTLDGESYTLFPGEVPKKLPQKSYWQQNQFEFYSYRPQPYDPSVPLPHQKMDKVLEFLLGDKLA